MRRIISIWMACAIISVVGGAIVLIFFMLPIQRKILRIAERGDKRSEESQADLHKIAEAIGERIHPKRVDRGAPPARATDTAGRR